MANKIKKAIDEQVQGVEIEKIEMPKEVDGENFLDNLSKQSEYIPLTFDKKAVDSSHPMMEADFFRKLQRETYVNNKILIMVRHKSAGLMNYLTMVDICFYDQEERKIIRTEAIPIYYKDLYKGLFGRKDYVFYANREDLPAIKSMLQADVKNIKAVDTDMAEFLKGINDDKETKLKDVKLSKEEKKELDKLDKL